MENFNRPNPLPVIEYESPSAPGSRSAMATFASIICMALWLTGIPSVASGVIGMMASIAAQDLVVFIDFVGLVIGGILVCCLASILARRVPTIVIRK